MLCRPIDVIARNGSGASITREKLARRPDPLGGKRLVIWEFAMRDLACENWRVVPIEAREPTAPTAPGAVVIDAELLTPIPAETRRVEVYTTALAVAKLRVLRIHSGSYQHQEILVKIPAILDRKLQPAVELQRGQRLRLHVLADAPPAFSSARMIDRTREFRLPLMWCEKFEPAPQGGGTCSPPASGVNEGARPAAPQLLC